MLQKEFFRTQSYNPDLPPETWTLVYANNTPGAFSFTGGRGKYRIEYSGGGGSGSSVACRSDPSSFVRNRSQQNGGAGERLVFYSNVFYGNNSTFSGTIGAGAEGSSTTSRSSYHSWTVGNPGSGYQSGTSGTATSYSHNPVLAGGSGGGSTSLFVNGGLVGISRGGNGGSASIQVNTAGAQNPPNWQTMSVSGGVGGSGGVWGNGAYGGAASYGAGSGSYNVSGSGGNGYVYIYKSNLYPEET